MRLKIFINSRHESLAAAIALLVIWVVARSLIAPRSNTTAELIVLRTGTEKPASGRDTADHGRIFVVLCSAASNALIVREL